jgi:hypothetical protein
MNGQEILRAEWAMAWEIERNSSEIFPCWCYECTRQHLIRIRESQAAIDKAIAAGEKVPSPEAKAIRRDWDDPWGNRFKTPYLLLDDEQRALLSRFYDTPLTNALQDIIKRALKSPAKRNGKPSAERVEAAIDSYETLLARFTKLYGGRSREGRSSFKAQLRVDLKALGVFRLQKAGYRWNRLPREPHDIELYRGQQRWTEALKRAQRLIDFAPYFVAQFLKDPQKGPQNFWEP